MRVGWLQDDPGYVGGAELTAQSFRDAAPKGVQTVDCPPGNVKPGLDRYVIQNCVRYGVNDLREIGDAPHVKYVHDMWPHGDPGVKQELLAAADLVFCSPAQRTKYGVEGYVVPPPIDTKRFVPWNVTERKGTCTIGAWHNNGKGQARLVEWAEEHDEVVDVYGPGLFTPHGPYLRQMGHLNPAEVPETLWRYERFVFLPTSFEPFGRCAVEAKLAGCELIVNKNIGGLEVGRLGLDQAAQNFWSIVTNV